jgi:hypothetical protein
VSRVELFHSGRLLTRFGSSLDTGLLIRGAVVSLGVFGDARAPPVDVNGRAGPDKGEERSFGCKLSKLLTTLLQDSSEETAVCVFSRAAARAGLLSLTGGGGRN